MVVKQVLLIIFNFQESDIDEIKLMDRLRKKKVFLMKVENLMAQEELMFVN